MVRQPGITIITLSNKSAWSCPIQSTELMCFIDIQKYICPKSEHLLSYSVQSSWTDLPQKKWMYLCVCRQTQCVQSKCKLADKDFSWELMTDKDIYNCKFRTDLICKILTWRLEMQFTFAMNFSIAASYQVSMLNVHEVLWFAPTTPTSQMNQINDYCANMVMITNRR